MACRPLRHESEIYDAAFSPDGRWLVTASRDGKARGWERTSGKPVTPARPLPGWGFQLLVRPNGQQLVTAGSFNSPVVMHLGDLTTSRVDELSAPDLIRWAEILSGQRLHEDGGVENLTPAEWLERWQAFRAEHPSFHSLSLPRK